MATDRGFEDIFAHLDALIPQIKAKAVEGAQRGATVLQEDAQATTAYFGQSGATRASTVAYVATTEDDGSSKANAALAIAEQLLDGFKGHDGAQLLEDSGESLSPDQVKIILTVPTDYIKALETDNGGQKAFLGDTLDNAAPFVLELIADSIRDLF
jgi:hypothetical protein